MNYQDINSKAFDKWNKEGWEWGTPISHEEFIEAKKGNYNLRLSPTKYLPHSWLGCIKDKKVLALASGGGQQCPILVALGANVTLLDYSDSQLERDVEFSKKENYEINIVKSDMSKPLPFEDNEFDMIINPISNCYIEDSFSLFKEISRILKPKGVFIAGLDIGINYIFDEENELLAKYKLPFNPLKDENLFNLSILNDWGIQFSHTIEDQIGGQLKNGLILTDIYEDYNGYGKLNELKVPTFIVTRAIKV